MERTVQIKWPLRISSDIGDAYSWSYSYSLSDVGDTIICLRNNSGTRNLHIDKIIVSGTMQATQVIIHHADILTTEQAIVITGVNLNFDSGKIAEASCVGNEVTNTQGDIIADFIILTDTPTTIDLRGAVILGLNDCIGIDFVSAEKDVCATIIGHYEKLNIL